MPIIENLRNELANATREGRQDVKVFLQNVHDRIQRDIQSGINHTEESLAKVMNEYHTLVSERSTGLFHTQQALAKISNPVVEPEPVTEPEPVVEPEPVADDQPTAEQAEPTITETIDQIKQVATDAETGANLS